MSKQALPGSCTTKICQPAASKMGTEQVMDCCLANTAEGQACSSCSGMRLRGEWRLSLSHTLVSSQEPACTVKVTSRGLLRSCGWGNTSALCRVCLSRVLDQRL